MNDLANIPEVTHEWGVILPEIFLGVTALLLLVLEVAVPKLKRALPYLAMGVQGLLAGYLGWLTFNAPVTDTSTFFGGMIAQGPDTNWMRIFFLLCGAFVSHLGLTYLKSRPLARIEFYHIQLVIVACFMLLVQSAHFGMLFVTLEALTIGFYLLVAYGRNSDFSLEAGLKYLITGALSSGIMLFGIVLLFGAASNPIFDYSTTQPLQFSELGTFFTSYHRMHDADQSLLALVGAGLVICGLAFKIGLVPFQVWIADVYQGAPTPVTAFLAVASKAAGIFVLINLLRGPFAELEEVTVPLLTVMTGATLLIGNLAALGQRNVKRLMGMSGVAHAGILILGVLALSSHPGLMPVLFFYLTVYALASFGVFEVMSHVGAEEDADQQFEDYSELMKTQPLLGGALAIGLGSLAGIPPLAGFIAKVLIFYAAIQAELYALLALAVFGVVCSIYYYFGWLRASVTKAVFAEEGRPSPVAPNFGAKVVLYGVSALSVFFGLYQGVFGLPGY